MPANLICMIGCITLLVTPALAQIDKFRAGTLIPDYGKIATIEGHEPLPENATFNISFDVGDVAEAGKLNRSLTSGARFLNMHVEAGVKPENINLAFVIHGSAVKDVTKDTHYKAAKGVMNANADLIAQLQKHGVEIFVCGQSAAYHGVEITDLLPGVKMSLSAMTVHAELQQRSFTLNPF